MTAPNLHFPDAALPDWLAGLTLRDIPAAQIHAAKQAMLDTLSVGWAGAAAEGVLPVLDCLCDGAAGSSALWGQGKTLAPREAALGNGLLCAALDFDIVHEGATAHTHIVMLPALLALAESTNASADDFLAAYIGGCEMAVRLGLGAGVNRGWGFSSVFGVLAGATACARLLGLNGDRVRAAAGIALSRAAGSQQTLIEGSFTKRLQSAFAARDAVEAALLAQCGVSAPSY
jgi:2-methylcitrate dehydratase PrpD